MPREIKFRGERLNRSEDEPLMVYGQFTWDAWHHPRITNEHGAFEIKPETIGQFTGLKDKNGKEIYEGDIFRSWNGNAIPVQWNQLYACFTTYGEHSEKIMVSSWKDREVIGNIYENAELLEQTKC